MTHKLLPIIPLRETPNDGIAQGWGSLKPNDAMHLATARRMEVSEMHTYDDRLLKWNGSSPFVVREPVVAQLPLSP